MLRSPLFPIFLIVLVDVLGFGIVIPLLPHYALHFGATPLIATTLVSVYAVCSLISTPIIGRLSDTYGRKPLLLYSLAGTGVGFLVLGFSTSLWMVFIGRILPGLAAGNLSIAQAYISDHTRPENRTKAFGIIGVAFGIGFMAGPALGGWLGEIELHLPFVVAAGMSAIAMFFTYLLLPGKATLSAARVTGPGGRRPGAFDWQTYAEYFGRPELRALYLQFFLFSFAFSCFFGGFALYAKLDPHFNWGPREVGWLFAYSGLLGVILQGGLLGRLVRLYGEFRLAIMSFAASVIAYALVGFATTVGMLVLAATVNSFGQGVLRPVLTARLTQVVGKHEQGTVLGISGSLGSVAMAMAPPTGGVLLDNAYLFAWAVVPAVVSLIGLLVTLGLSGVTERAIAARASAPDDGELHSAP